MNVNTFADLEKGAERGTERRCRCSSSSQCRQTRVTEPRSLLASRSRKN